MHVLNWPATPVESEKIMENDKWSWTPIHIRGTTLTST